MNAELPPSDLPGYDPSWSRLVTIANPSRSPGTPDRLTFHLLDHCEGSPELTILCIHGNPSWSYLWRRVIQQAPRGVRVIAPDHLNMGWSQRIDSPRTLAQRIADLSALTDALEIATPVVTLAHDWGGPISLGWAQAHRDDLAGVILTNTAVHQPADAAAPRLITAIRTPGIIAAITERTPAFIRGGLRLSSPEPPPEVRRAFLAPYQTAARRKGVRDFVEDIPLKDDHVSYAALIAIEDGMADLADTPALLLWGTKDPVFNELYLRDFEQRLPHADVHRFTSASHFVTEDAPAVEAALAWISNLFTPPLPRNPPQSSSPLLPELDVDPLVTERDDGDWRSISSRDFVDRTHRIARGLIISGVRPGDRVATLIPPGIDLTAVIYAFWQIGVAAVLVDGGLGVRNMHRAIRAADPGWIVGIPPAMVASRALRWDARRIVVGEMDARLRRISGVSFSLREVELAGEGGPIQTENRDALAAILFTSGSTGPSKGVCYTASQLAAQRDSIGALYAITPEDRLVAAFAPFALYGPALGIGSIVPEMDVTKPSTLTADALADAAARVGATLIFASPSAIRSVVASSESLNGKQREALANVRLVMSAGAPMSMELLESILVICPNAEVHTPYGMTEALPIADISLAERRSRGSGSGACVGRPVAGVEVRIHPLDENGTPAASPATDPGVHGEVVVRASHQKASYHRLWWTEHQSRTDDGWHRTGDTGSLDSDGYLWITGRVQHLITTAGGVLAPVPFEHAAESIPSIVRAAAVGVGPVGVQVPVVVVQTAGADRKAMASASLRDAVRAACSEANLPEPAAVLWTGSIPVDKRHNSKVDRTRIAEWASKVLAGRSFVRL